VKGSCDSVDCAIEGQSNCLDNKTVNVCQKNNSFQSSPCLDGSSCSAGACRESPCEAGATVCGWKAVATCNEAGVIWEGSSCEPDQVCTGGACVPEMCQPGTWSCLDETTKGVCNQDGSDVIETLCKSNEECVEAYGECVPKLRLPPDLTDVVDSPDIEEEDEGPPPVDKGPPAELEPLDLAACTIDGVEVKFVSNLSATYVEKDKDLRVSMDKGQLKIEITMAPLDEYDIGHWTSAEAGDIQVHILYNDGSDIGGAQWKYQSVEYDLELSKFESKGGRVKGVFTGALTPDGGKSTIPLTDCFFDVVRHD
jgi:hypothetical protein